MPDPNQTYMVQCPTIPTLVGSEMRFSIESCEIKPVLDWPWLQYVKHQEITPPQHRFQWGRETDGARLDDYTGLRFGNRYTFLELGARSTNANGRLAPVENQRVGMATLAIDGKYLGLDGQLRAQYWNDHSFWWWPMGDGGDQGDTAGLSFSYLLGNQGFPVADGWYWRKMQLSMRLATGIPDRGSAVPQGGHLVYSRVQFDEINRGDLNLNTQFTNTNHQILDVGITVNSGAVRHFTQSEVVHRNLGIPEFPPTDQLEFMVYVRLQQF